MRGNAVLVAMFAVVALLAIGSSPSMAPSSALSQTAQLPGSQPRSFSPSASEQECARMLGIPTLGMIRDIDRQLLLNPEVCNAYTFLISRHQPGPQSKIGLSNPQVQGITGLNQGFAVCLARFIQAGEAAGHRMTIHSGYRTCDAQKAIFASARPGYAASGCNSMHNKGVAADLTYTGGARQWAHQNARQFGMHFRLSHEPWHLEPIQGGACITPDNGPPRIPSGTPGQTPPPVTPPTTQPPASRPPAAQPPAPHPMQQPPPTAPVGTQQARAPVAGLPDMSPSLFVGSRTDADGTTSFAVFSEDGTLLSEETTSANSALNQLLALVGGATSSTATTSRPATTMVVFLDDRAATEVHVPTSTAGAHSIVTIIPPVVTADTTFVQGGVQNQVPTTEAGQRAFIGRILEQVRGALARILGAFPFRQ